MGWRQSGEVGGPFGAALPCSPPEYASSRPPHTPAPDTAGLSTRENVCERCIIHICYV